MITPSHRIRVEEKKLYRRFIKTIALLLFAVILFIYAGLPLVAKIIVGVSSLRREKPAKTTAASLLLFPPVLEATFEATNSAKITIVGFADKEATVKIFVNEREKAKVLVDNEGKFKATNILLTEGPNIITAQTVKGNQESSISETLSIVYKKNSPKLEIESPSDGQKLSGNAEITISGETEPGNRVTVNDRFVIVDPDGKFDHPLKLDEGENTFKIVAIDIAGNKITVERKATYTP